MGLDSDDLIALAENGNRKRAKELVDALPAAELLRTAALIEQAHVRPGFYAPLIDQQGRWDMFARVDVEPSESDTLPETLVSTWHGVVRGALDEAWRLVGGPGARPRCAIRLPLLERPALAFSIGCGYSETTWR